MLAFLLHLSALAAVAQGVSIHQLIEDEALVLSAGELFPAPIAPGTFAITESPRHGVATVLAADVLDYTPDPSYAGFDDLTVEANLAEYPFLRLTTDVELRVLPRALPIAGRFDNTGFDSPGYYDTAERVFNLCQPWVFGSAFSCLQHGVPEALVGWLPVVGDWDGNGRDLPSLFDPATGTLHLLEMKNAGPLPPGRGPDLEIKQSAPRPATAWSWPIAGDWDGDGRDSLAFYDRSGTIRSVDEEVGLGLETWDEVLGPLSGDDLPWPVTWHVEPVDAVGVVDRLTGEFLWRSRFDETDRSNEPIDLRGWGHRLPLTGEHWAFFSGHATALLRFGVSEVAGEPRYQISLALPGTPSTIAVHFPNDPPSP